MFFPRPFRSIATAVAACLIYSRSELYALDGNDLLFHLTFDNGLKAEFSAGASEPAIKPEDAGSRFEEGVKGKGYLFGPKGSTLEYPIAADGSRISQEMYGPNVNLFAEAGTVSFWMKTRSNTAQLQHYDLFRFGDAGAFHDHWRAYQMSYNGKTANLTPVGPQGGRWVHMVMTWGKGEVTSYINGVRTTTLTDCGVIETPIARFVIAGEGKATASHSPAGSFEHGVIDEVQVFSRPLSPEEVYSLFERVHVNAAHSDFLGKRVEYPPARAFMDPVMTCPRAAAGEIVVDGNLDDWNDLPASGALIDTRLNVVDPDLTTVSIASDDRRLYFSFSSGIIPPDEGEMFQIRFPTSIYRSGPRQRDGEVHQDDYIEMVLKTAEHEYRFALNPHGTLLDARDGQPEWNGDTTWKAVSDRAGWTGELSVSFAELGIKPGDPVEYNVIRSWKKYKSAMDALFVDATGSPRNVEMKTSAPASAAIASVGEPWNGAIELKGKIQGPAGKYQLLVSGKGHGNSFEENRSIEVAGETSDFSIEHQQASPGDVALSIDVRDPQGQSIHRRTIPYVYVSTSRSELLKYPGWGRLGVAVTPLRPDGASAAVTLSKDGQTKGTKKIESFGKASESVLFDLSKEPAGRYDVLVELMRNGKPAGEERLSYEKTPLPDWYGSTIGVIDHPPVPWTDMEVDGGSVKMLIKQVDFKKSLFPTQIISNDQSLLAGPIRIRATRNGKDVVLAADRFEMTEKTSRRVSWKASAKEQGLSIAVEGSIEFDGFTWFNITSQGGTVDALALEAPLARSASTLTTAKGQGLLPAEPFTGEMVWIGNEKAGIQFAWENQKGWSPGGNQPLRIVPGTSEVLVTIPFIQQATNLSKPRTITMGWAITPSKPIRPDRWERRLKGITYTTGGYTYARPNYPSLMPGETADSVRQGLKWHKEQGKDIVLWYAFGPQTWISSPEYADWWREWRVTSLPENPPKTNSSDWAPACYKSSAHDLFYVKLDEFMRNYGADGCYVDCYALQECDNEAHGCGWVDENGVRHMSLPLLAMRRAYERLYNIIKTNNPQRGWLRMHDWGPIMPVMAFCDENWVGEGHIGPMAATPEKNYFQVLDLPKTRVQLGSVQWGHLTNWLTELAVYAGEDPDKRSEWMGKMVSPPTEGQHGVWIVPRMADYQHVAGLALVNNIWDFGGNDAGISLMLVNQMFRDIGMDDSVRFIGYWEVGDRIRMTGGVPEKIVCSAYVKPPRDNRGKPQRSWVMLIPFNNTDREVNVRLKGDLQALGFAPVSQGQFRDVYKAVNLVYPGTYLERPTDPEPPYFEFKGVDERFDLVNGEVEFKLPKRSFKALLLESNN